ncbi:metal-sulfur cluster assembly factor [Methylobacterium oxalidis]|uniref:metal-sulfur cluster assembly factor n=1 Tax=Methylobacterium oxalidis TaxID=944322 RepID=UPI0033159BBF
MRHEDLPSAPHAHHKSAGGLDPEVLDCLEEVQDPEVGLSIAHLGLVYRAVRTAGRIEVDLTLTARTCPLGGLLVEEVRTCLLRRFGGNFSDPGRTRLGSSLDAGSDHRART